jgi:hypothetical protein
MRRIATLLGLAAAGAAFAQMPDVAMRFDLRMSYQQEAEGTPALRWYDSLGRHSLVAFSLTLEPGLQAFVSQKLQRIPNDADPEQLDEYFVEDAGNWKLGKQYLPFGSGRILRESVLAVRADHTLFAQNVRAALAVCDGGPGRPQGVVARLGGPLGVSAAVGRHFGVAGTALTLVRRPEDSPGRGRGHNRALGVDYSFREGPVVVRGEWVSLRGGETAEDRDLDVFDISLLLAPSRERQWIVGFTRETRQGASFMRLEGRVHAVENVFVEPIVRFKDGKFYDLGIAATARF